MQIERGCPSCDSPIGGILGESKLALELARKARINRLPWHPRRRGKQLAGDTLLLGVDQDKNLAGVLTTMIAQKGFGTPRVVNQLLPILFEQAL